jgi:hypothetical protein
MTEMPSRQASGPLKHHYRGPFTASVALASAKEITWLFRKRHPKWEIRWHVLIAEWKWSLSVSNQFCSAGNSRISRSHVRSAVLRKNSGSSAVDDPKPACLSGPAVAETLEFSGSIDLNYAGIGDDGREFTPAVGKFAPAPGTFRKCSPCRGVRRPGCVFFAASLVIEAFLHPARSLHTWVTRGAIECAA